MLFPRPVIKLPSALFTLLLAAYFILVLNQNFWSKFHEAIAKETHVTTGFTFITPLAFIFIFNILFTPFTIKRFEKIFFGLLIVLSAVADYATYTYGVYINKDMIQNVMETNPSEADSYLNLPFALWVAAAGLLPVIVMCFIKITYAPLGREILRKIASVIISALILAAIWSVYSVDYIAIGRNHKGLEKDIVPTYFLSSTTKYFKEKYFDEKRPYTDIGTDAARPATAEAANGKKDLMILVVGETARAANYAYNGYERDTNAHTKDMGLIAWQNVSSCGTATAVSVPCMFSMLSRDDYKENIAKTQSNVLDILYRADIDQYWVENDEGCKSVCYNIPHEDQNKAIEPYCDGKLCRDLVLLQDLPARIDTMKGKHGIITLHIMGSHGPTYHDRYTDEDRVFEPDCPRSDIQNCNREEIINTYDNTILYTDKVIAEIIKVLKGYEDRVNPSLLYLSDHGESLGENGIYLHGMPYAIAPKEQTHVPFMMWLPEQTAKAKNIDLSCLKDMAKTNHISHDNLSHSLLGYMDVQTSVYHPEMDIFKPCRQ